MSLKPVLRPDASPKATRAKVRRRKASGLRRRATAGTPPCRRPNAWQRGRRKGSVTIRPAAARVRRSVALSFIVIAQGNELNFPSKLRRTILCLPLIFWIADRAEAAPAMQAGSGSGAQRVAISVPEFERCQGFDILLGGQTWRVACERVVTAPGVRYWEGHVDGAPAHKLSLQIRPEGVSGLLDLPDRPLRLGLVDGVQWLLDTPAADLRAELADTPPPLFVLRTPQSATEAATLAGQTDTPDLPSGRHASDAPAAVAYPVALNLADLAAVEPGGQVDLALPGMQHGITYERTTVSPTGTSTWIGYLTQYGRDYPVVLTYGVDGSATGSVQGPSGEWLLTGTSGKTWLVDTSASGIRHNPGAKDDDALPPPQAAADISAFAAGATASAGSATAIATADTAATNTVIDVLVLYTPGLVSRYGGQAGAATRIDHFISLANQAYSSGNVGITLRRVGMQVIDIADNTGNSATLDLLRRASGAFSAIPALRNATGADGVMLVRPFDMAGQGGNCGVGYVGGYGGSPMSAYAELAYAVVSEGNDTKGQPYYCTDTTFAHELGHNMGLMHDRATVASQGGGNGALPYAFGYGKSGQFGTIMSYIHPVVVRFSNPNDTSCNGPCGIDSTDAANSADNARALGITRSAFSAFRATTTQASVSIAGIVTIDGKAAVNVPILAGGTPCATTSSTGAYACTFAAGWSGTVAASAANVTFTPSSQAFSNVQQSASRNFVGVTRTVSITGTATVGGKLASGVTVTAGSTGCGTTTSTGTFACKVAYGWSGSVSATSAAATFTSVALTSVTANRTIQLIGTARPTSFPIKGTVRVNGIATAGVTITANNVTCGTTNAAGAYTCTVAARSSGVLKAAFAGAGFSPSARSYTDIAAAFTQNFEGTRPQVAITGAVTVKGVRRAGVAVQAGGTACGVTNAAGEFACSRPKAWSGRVLAPSISTAMYVDVVNLSAPIRVTLAQR